MVVYSDCLVPVYLMCCITGTLHGLATTDPCPSKYIQGVSVSCGYLCGLFVADDTIMLPVKGKLLLVVFIHCLAAQSHVWSVSSTDFAAMAWLGPSLFFSQCLASVLVGSWSLLFFSLSSTL